MTATLHLPPGSTLVSIIDAEAGPCTVTWDGENREQCGRPTVMVSFSRPIYGQVSGYVHADGSLGHGINNTFVQPDPKCPKCRRIGSLTTVQEAYGDRTTCGTDGCDYKNWFSIGD